MCHGRHELEEALERRAMRGLTSELEEVAGNGEHVMVVARTPGVDAYRVRPADDRSFTVFTVRDGRIVAIRDCHEPTSGAWVSIPAILAGSTPACTKRRSMSAVTAAPFGSRMAGKVAWSLA